MLPVAVLLASAAASYTTLFAPKYQPASPFSGVNLATHSTGLVDDAQCPAEPLPTRLDVAAPPRALPRRASPGGEGGGSDPLDLWSPPKAPRGPKGPSVYTLNLGRAIDYLKRDYPLIFSEKPAMSIFTKEVELHDPSGPRLRGIKQYAKVFDMLRFLRRTTMQDAQVTYRIVVVDDRIRVRWSAMLWMRDPALGLTTMANGEPAVVHLDGVSNYDLNDEGKITRHVMENIIMRGSEQAEPVKLALNWPSVSAATPELVGAGPFFRPVDTAAGWAPPRSLSAFFEEPTLFEPAGGEAHPQAAPEQSPPQQNIAARPSKRRTGPPHASAVESPMERAARERAEDAEKARRLEELRTQSVRPPDKLFGVSMPQQCETSYDCERPDVCCDLLFSKVCCNGGLMIPTADGAAALQRQAIPVPVEKDDGLPRFPGPGNLPPNFPTPP